MEVLNNLLVNAAEVGCIPIDTPIVPTRSLSFSPPTTEEIQASLFRAENTATGSDEIPSSIISSAWSVIEPYIQSLFSGCLTIGHPPKCFRHAVLVMPQKSNKSDLSSPRPYRPIALLSVMGKGLERLLAKRIAWTSICHKLLTNQLLGALPCRSAIDLTSCPTHEIERALNEGRTASMLTLDIKAAFDAVLPGQFVKRMCEQGWPENLVRWVTSLITGRTVKIRLDGDIAPSKNITCGLP